MCPGTSSSRRIGKSVAEWWGGEEGRSVDPGGEDAAVRIGLRFGGLRTGIGRSPPRLRACGGRCRWDIAPFSRIKSDPFQELDHALRERVVLVADDHVASP